MSFTAVTVNVRNGVADSTRDRDAAPMETDATKTELIVTRAGEPIEDAASRAVMAAKARKRAIVLRAYGTTVIVSPNDLSEQVVARWSARRA